MTKRTPSVLMIAYTSYLTDPRVIRAAEAAAEAGFDVDVLSLRRSGDSAEEVVRGVRVIRLPQARYRGRSRFGYLLAYSEFIARCFISATRLYVGRRYGVVHVHNMPDVLVFAALVPRLLGAKVLLDIHDPMPETLGAKYGTANANGLYRFLAFLERLSVGFAHRAVTVNHPLRDRLNATRGYSPGVLDVVANFADDRLFRPMQPPKVEGRVSFVFHGTILERYGLRTLVEAVARLRHRDRVLVRIIGEGDFSEPLKRLIAQHGLEDTIHFDNRLYPLSQLPEILSDCHVGLVPLDVTPVSDLALPLKLVEYTCLGLPSITVTTTAINYYFRPDECLFYSPGDIAALARILDDIAERPEQLHAYMGRLPAVRARVSWCSEKAKYVAMLREMIEAA
jgi:glycosyltransferase involved in cell wall biosynthesis